VENNPGGKTMSNDVNPGGCCAKPIKGLSRLTFPDGSQVGVNGLNEILAVIYAEGKQVSNDTAEEIVDRLEEKNYIPPSARREYQNLLLKEYRKYVADRKNNNPT